MYTVKNSPIIVDISVHSWKTINTTLTSRAHLEINQAGQDKMILGGSFHKISILYNVPGQQGWLHHSLRQQEDPRCRLDMHPWNYLSFLIKCMSPYLPSPPAQSWPSLRWSESSPQSSPLLAEKNIPFLYFFHIKFSIWLRILLQNHQKYYQNCYCCLL